MLLKSADFGVNSNACIYKVILGNKQLAFSIN